MLRHVVMMKWTAEATDEQKARVPAELSTLPGAIPELKRYEFGPDAGISEGNFDFAVVADFDNADDYAVYRDHPAHRKIIHDHIVPILATRAAVQYRL